VAAGCIIQLGGPRIGDAYRLLYNFLTSLQTASPATFTPHLKKKSVTFIQHRTPNHLMSQNLPSGYSRTPLSAWNYASIVL